MERLKVRRTLNNAFQILKDYDDQHSLIYSAEIFTIIEGEMKTFHDINRLKSFIFKTLNIKKIKQKEVSFY